MKKRLGIASIFLVCILWIYFILVDYHYERIYQKIEESNISSYTAIVVSEGTQKEYKTNYTIQLMGSKCEDIRILLSVKKNQVSNLPLQYGDIIHINGTIELPSAARNSGGFDYRNYLKIKKIVGIITCKNENISVIGRKKLSVLTEFIQNVSTHIKNTMKKVLPEKTAGIAIAMLIGERTGITEEINTYFQNSSLTHMLAISGSHIVYIVLLVGILFQKVGNKISKIILIILLIFYIFLTQITPSVTRACVMTIMTTIASFIHRKPNIYVNLVVATVVLLWINPYYIWDMGFQLSFGGTIGIILFEKRLESERYQKLQSEKNLIIQVRKYIADIIRVTIAANLIIIPIMAMQFHTLSLTFWLSNLLAAPLMGVMIIGGFILYVVSSLHIVLGNILAIPYNLLLELFTKIAEYTGNIPFSKIWVIRPSICLVLLYYFLLMIIFYKQELKKWLLEKVTIQRFMANHKVQKIKQNWYYVLAILCMAIILLSFISYFWPQNLQIHFVDVGQGDSTLIITPKNQSILIDGGGNDYAENFDVGKQILLPYLLNRGISHLDYIVISHFDSDHVRRNSYNNARTEGRKCDYRKTVY